VETRCAHLRVYLFVDSRSFELLTPLLGLARLVVIDGPRYGPGGATIALSQGPGAPMRPELCLALLELPLARARQYRSEEKVVHETCCSTISFIRCGSVVGAGPADRARCPELPPK
jgi:hypothetical protein